MQVRYNNPVNLNSDKATRDICHEQKTQIVQLIIHLSTAFNS